MLKRYCLYQFKRWWPLLVIFSVVMSLVFCFALANWPLTYAVHHGTGGASYRTGSDTAYSGALFISCTGLLAAFVMPMFVFSYRTSKQGVDSYYQAAYGPLTIKRARMLLGLGIVLASFTAAYLLGVFIYGMRYLAMPEHVVNGSGTYATDVYRCQLHFIYYIPLYFVLTIIIAAQYFVNCFLVSLGNYTFDQICLLVFGNALLSLFFLSPCVYLMRIGHNGQQFVTILTYMCNYGLGVYPPQAMMTVLFEPLFGHGRYGIWQHSDINMVIAGALSLLASGGIAVVTFFMRDPSGEYADKSGQTKTVVALIPHGVAICGAFLCAAGSGLMGTYNSFLGASSAVFIYLLYCAVYYILLSLWRHSFKPSWLDLTFYFCVIGTAMLLFLTAGIA